MSLKVCQNCQVENDDSAMFCYQCGNKFPEQSESKQICRNCTVENPRSAKFCGNCGNPFSEGNENIKAPQKKTSYTKKRRGSTASGSGKQKALKRPTRPKPRKQQSPPMFSNSFVIGVLVLGGIIALLFFMKNTPKAESATNVYVEQRTNDVELENKVRTVASQFVCACGSCPSEPLETCACPTARRERDYIRNALNIGQPENVVIAALNDKFGGLKKNNPSLSGNDIERLALPSNLDVNIGENSISEQVSENAIASVANRADIIARFTCPCGQCNKDELKDCQCDHPNGAKEVKQFIDQKINEGNHTVAQVIELVNSKYGGKIR